MFATRSLHRHFSSATAAARRAANLERTYGRAINLSAGCAALPLEVLKEAQKNFVDTNNSGLSVTEMGYRTSNFHQIMDESEASFRQLMNIPDNYEVHFFNGGATLQFSALPLNLLTEDNKKCNYIMSGHWSEKARNEAKIFSDQVREMWEDPTGLYFTLPHESEWKLDKDAKYIHYTAADTRQGFEFQEFPYHVIPDGVPLVCDASANLGSKPVDVSKYGVLYAAAHKNFSTSGACYTIIRKDLIPEKPLPGCPTMCNWSRFQTAPNKIWNVPVIFAIWLGKLTTEWMLRQGGLPYFEKLAIDRSNLLYNMVDNSNGFYNCFVNESKYRSRMNIVFTIKSGNGADAELVQKFLTETSDDLGWLDIRSHPLGIESDAIRVTTYNAQTIEAVEVVRDFMHDFQKRHQ